jgi:hypothetical protein
VRVKAAPIDRTLILNDKIWTERLRIDHVVIFQASVPRIYNAAVLIALAAGDLVAATASALADLVAEGALAGSAAGDFAEAVAGSGADGNN